MREWFTRRSIRFFQDRPVEPEKIEAMLRAASQAPSAGNRQPWEFLVIHSRDTLERLSGMSEYAKPAGRCTVAVLLLARQQHIMWQQDMAACAQNMLLEAVYQGLGAVWLGVAPHEPSMAFVREVFALPQGIEPFALIAAGYPEDRQNEYTDRFLPGRVHYEKWD